MPLIHSSSKEARQENIHREIEAGKPIKQAVAIGYSVQREAMNNHRQSQLHEREKEKYGKA